MSNNTRFRIPFDSQYVKVFQTLMKSTPQYFYPIILSLWEKVSWKVPLIVIFQILRMLLNTLTADDKYSLRNRRKLPQAIEKKLSKKEKAFFYVAILKTALKFEHFSKRDEPHSWCIFEIKNSEKVSYLIV